MDILKSNIIVGLTAGVAATLLAPVLVPAVAMAVRPLAKSLLKGGVILYEKGREALAGAGEEMEDLIAEVRSELANEYGYAASGGATATGATATAASAAGGASAPVQDAARKRDAEEDRSELQSEGRAFDTVRHSGNGAQAS